MSQFGHFSKIRSHMDIVYVSQMCSLVLLNRNKDVLHTVLVLYTKAFVHDVTFNFAFYSCRISESRERF